MLNCYHGRTKPILPVLSTPPFAGGRLSGGRWLSPRRIRKLSTRIVTGAPGCRE